MPAAFGRFREPESVRTNHHAVLQNYVIAQSAVLAHYRVSMRKEVVADLDPAIDDRMREQNRVRPDHHVLVNHDIRSDVSVCPYSRTGVHDRGGVGLRGRVA